MFSQFYFATVTDNKDPDSLHRVRVTKLGEEDAVTEWVPVVTQYSGNAAGLSSLPDVDEEVLVVALDPSGARKAVIGSVWSTASAPPETGENGDADLNADGKNALHFIKSKAGSMLILDDSEGKEKIQIIAPDGKARIEFSVADELVTLDTENDVTIGAKGNITIQAEEISITSKKAMSLTGEEIAVAAKKKLDITADQDITIKGSGIALN